MLKSVYNVEDAVDALASYKGKAIEVSVARGEGDDDPGREYFAALSGVVDRMVHSPGPSEHWTVYFERDDSRPNGGSVTIWRDGYEGTDRDGEPDRLIIRQRGLMLSVTAYL